MDTYFLIARSRKDNSFTVLKLQETWYLGREKGRQGVLTRENDLEAIDLVTTRFGSEEEMANRMAMNGYIPDSDVDIFIASKRQKDGKSYIRFDEVIYNPDKDRRIDSLRRIALTSLASDFKDDKYDIDSIYDEVIALSYMADDYLAMLLDGDMNVSLRFAEQLRGVQQYSEIPYFLKERVGFGADSYLVLRNIVESINRLEQVSTHSRADRFAQNADFIGKNLSGRMALVPDLAMQLDKSYVEGQLSLFSLLDDKGKEQVVEATKKVAEEEKLIPQKIHIPRSGVSDYDKRKEVFRVLRHAEGKVFYKDKETDTYKVNYDVFTSYPPTEDEARKLNTYLTGKLPKYFAHYIYDYRMLCECQKDSFTPPSEIAELQTEVEYDIRKVDARFKSAKTLNMAYEWCMLYEGARKRDKAVSEGAKVSSDLDDKAKTYGKK